MDKTTSLKKMNISTISTLCEKEDGKPFIYRLLVSSSANLIIFRLGQDPPPHTFIVYFLSLLSINNDCFSTRPLIDAVWRLRLDKRHCTLKYQNSLHCIGASILSYIFATTAISVHSF